MAALLDIRDLTVAFGANEAVRGAAFEIHPGETVALVGESGSGKSSAIALLMGYERPTAGTVRLDGEAVEAAAARASIAWAGQTPRIVAGSLADMEAMRSLTLARAAKRITSVPYW